MTKTIQFNKGTMSVEKDKIIWQIPTKDIQCISINELHYLNEINPFSIPVNDIELNDEQLVFSWNIQDTYKPITSVQKEDKWFQLKTAKSLLANLLYVENHHELFTVYDQANFYVDENYHVKMLLFTKAIHLPHHKSSQDYLTVIKQIVLQLFSKDAANDEFVEQIEQATGLVELENIIEEHYNNFLVNIDKERLANRKAIQKTKRTYLLVAILSIVAVGLITYFLTNNAEELAELMENNEVLEQKVGEYENYVTYVTSYDAYFSGDVEKALKIANNIEANVTINDQYYMNLLIDNGEIEQALNQFPKEAHRISEAFVLNAETDEILSFQTDNPYIKFEQAVFMDEKEIIDDIIPQLDQLTDRQKEVIYEHYKNNNIDQAIQFAKEHKNLNWLVDSLETKKGQLEKEVKKLSKEKNKKKRKQLNDEIKEITKQLESLT